MAVPTSTQLTPLQSSYSVIKIDIDSVIQQLLAVKDTPGKQVHSCCTVCLLTVKARFMLAVGMIINYFMPF